MCLAMVVGLGICLPFDLEGQTAPPVDSLPSSLPASRSTAAIFRTYSNAVLKVQVLEKGSSAKASFGSGFFVSQDGLIVTNYHVVAKVVNDPQRYRADATDVGGKVYPVEVLAVDVVHDLAVLRSKTQVPRWFTLGDTRVDQGDRLYSMGHPHDLGLSVVEGTYNGLLAHTLYPKIHFTGSINPGMSGGPAISAVGKVVGINVSTAGDGIGFLVPASKASELLARVQQQPASAPPDFRRDITEQIWSYQNEYLRDMFLPGAPVTRLGRYTVPTRPAPFFKCWADAWDGRERPYRMSMHDCSTDDELFISDEQQSGVVEMEHRLIVTEKLLPTQFYTLLTSELHAESSYPTGSKDDVTKFSCTTRNVGKDAQKMRVVFCARTYKKLPGLYDAIVQVATLGVRNAGLLSTLRLSGVSYANAKTLTDRYIRSIKWTR